MFVSGSPLGASSNCHEVIPDNSEDAQIDESNQVEPWVQALSEDDYCDLSVEERLNALVALITVATEGNSIRAVLEVMILLKPPIYLLFLSEKHLMKCLAGTLGVSKCFEEANVGRGPT